MLYEQVSVPAMGAFKENIEILTQGDKFQSP